MSETKGYWKSSNAGGCFNTASWRLNQQYSLKIEATVTDFKLELCQEGTSHNIGLYLLKDTHSHLQPIYHNGSEKVIHKSGFKAKSVVTIEVPTLKKGTYHVIPCTFEPGKEGKFVLKANHGKLKRISMWHMLSWSGKWKGDTAGGCKNHKSFKNNPQYLFSLEGDANSSVTGVVYQNEVESDFSNLGFYLIKADGSGPLSRISSKDIVATSEFEDENEACLEVQELTPGHYSFLPCTFDDKREASFKVYLFSSLPIQETGGAKQEAPAAEEHAKESKEQTTETTSTANKAASAEMTEKWASEVKAHQETLKKLSELQEQMRTLKESNYGLEQQLEALRKGGQESSQAAPTGPRVDTTEPQSGKQVSVLGSWKGKTAGGCMNHSTWRDNPQLFLSVPSDGTKTIFTLVQEPNEKGKLSQIGFYIIHGSLTNGRRTFWLDQGDDDIVMKAKFTSSKQQKLEVTLPATSPKQPYILIPCTFNAGEEHNWTLTIVADSDVTVSPSPPSGEWHSHTVVSEWTKETAGGCKNHATFLDNPQYLLTIPEGPGESNLRIMMFQNEHEEFDSISAYIIKTNFAAGAKKSKLAKIDANDIIQKPRFGDPNETCITFDQSVAPGTYTIIPCTFTPKQLAHFELRVFSSKPTQLEELAPASEVSVLGEWKGKTAGGCMNDIITFKNNPQFRLTLKEHHEVMFKQIQTSGEMVSQGFYIFKSKTGRRKFKIGKDDLSAKSGFAKTKELIGDHKLLAGEYVIIPCTFTPGEEASFKLAAYSKNQAANFSEICNIEPIPHTYQEFNASSEWKQGTDGGCLNYTTWVTNPQFQFTTDKKTEVVIYLSVPSLTDAEKITQFSGIGFYIAKSHSDCPVLLELSPKDIIKKAAFRKSQEVATSLTLEAGSYNIVAATFKSGYHAQFDITLFTDNMTSASFTSLANNSKSFLGKWDDSSAGGNTSNMEMWLKNPRYYISVKKSMRLAAVILQKPELSFAKGDKIAESTWKPVGFAVTNADSEGRPRTSQSSDLIAMAPFEAEREVSTTFYLEPSMEPYVIVPSLFEAGVLGTFQLSIVFDPTSQDFIEISSTPPNINAADFEEQFKADVLIGKLQKCINTTALSSAELGRLISSAGLVALESTAGQLNSVVKRLQAVLNALKAPDLYAKELEAAAVQIAEETAPPAPPAPPMPSDSSLTPPVAPPVAPPVPKTSQPSAPEEVYDGASKGLKPAGERKLAPKTYSSPQEEMLAIIAQGRAQLKNAAERKLKDKPVQNDGLFCAFSSSFDQIAARRRAVEGEDEESDDDDDDWD